MVLPCGSDHHRFPLVIAVQVDEADVLAYLERSESALSVRTMLVYATL